MSRKAIDVATEITVAWLTAIGSGGSAKGYYASKVSKDQIIELFEAVYKKVKEIDKQPAVREDTADF